MSNRGLTKTQVVFIHWWETKENYRNYKEALLKYEYNPYKEVEKSSRWTKNLQKILWEDFFVINPVMPNKYYCDYSEWVIMFEKILPFLESDYILSWHSLWATFLLKYLSENDVNVSFSRIILIAPAYKDSEIETLWSFSLNDDKLKTLQRYEDKMTFYHSEDDFIVPFADLKSFKSIFPNASYNIFKDKWHFMQDNFDEFFRGFKKTYLIY